MRPLARAEYRPCAWWADTMREVVHLAAPDGRTCSRCGATLVTGSAATFTPERPVLELNYDGGRAFWMTTRPPSCKPRPVAAVR